MGRLMLLRQRGQRVTINIRSNEAYECGGTGWLIGVVETKINPKYQDGFKTASRAKTN
jgi:hypothetical protein